MRKRKVLLMLLCLVLVYWSFPVTASPKEVIIKDDNLNLRGGPGTNYEKLGQVHKDEVYTVLQEQNGWIEIQLNDYTAWVSTNYVTFQGEFTNSKSSESLDTEEESPNTTNKQENKVQNTISVPNNNTHVRRDPSTESEIVFYVKKGEQLQVIGENEKWLKVKHEDSEGYVFKELVEDKVDKMVGLKGKTIVIDPGHGGDDSGALSVNEVFEKDLTYKTADILAHELSMLGVEVIMTREKEAFVSLSSRATLSNVENADAFISLHYNSVPNLPNATGISTYYYHEQYELLATYIQQEIIKETGDRDRGADFGDFQVIRQNLMPGVLIELGFISNPEIEQLLLTNAYQEKMVSGIVNGLRRYFAIEGKSN